MKDKKRKQNATNNGTIYFYFSLWNQIVKQKTTVKFKPSSELCFQNLYQQIKPQFKKMPKSMREMADQGEELPQEHKKKLEWYGKYWKEIKEE